MMAEHHPLVAILGPTAVGKTAISIRLAERFDAEVVSADSRTFYRRMDIGTAKPTPEERGRVPHHLIDVADPEEVWSLAKFRRTALAAIADIQARGRLPFLVGGTGQYVTAVLEGWSPPPGSGDPRLRHELESFAAEHGARALHQRLAAIDPARAEQIDPRNVRRVARALEIYHLTGLPPSRQRERISPPFRALRIGLTLPRPELYARIDARIEAMLSAGWVDEVRNLLDRGISVETPSMSAIGYRQIAAALQGRMTMEEAVGEIRRLTRVFVRRQANWFRADDPEIRWFAARESVEGDIAACIDDWLATGKAGRKT